MTNPWSRHALLGSIAAVGLLLAVAGGFIVFGAFVDRSGGGGTFGVGIVLLVVGVGAQGTAILLSVLGAWQDRRNAGNGHAWPLVAVAYGVGALVAAGAYAAGEWKEEQWYETPGAATAEPNAQGTGIDVRTAAGTRTVGFDRCPGGENASASVSVGLAHGLVNGVSFVDVSLGLEEPYMRIFTGDGREECLEGEWP